MSRIINKLFYKPTWAIACRKINPNQDIFPNTKQNPYCVLLPNNKEWYADSFCVCDNDKVYIFVEIMGRNGRLGTLGVTEFSKRMEAQENIV